MHPEMDGAYEVVDDVVCYACKAKQEYVDDHKGKVEPGVVLRVVDSQPDAVLPPWDPDADLDDDAPTRPGDVEALEDDEPPARPGRRRGTRDDEDVLG